MSNPSLTLTSYQEQALRTALPTARSPEYMLFGLASEAGEVCGKWKKRIRDGTFDEVGFRGEIGDVLWYVAGLCSEMGYSLEEVAQLNLDKLSRRQSENKLVGSGDAR